MLLRNEWVVDHVSRFKVQRVMCEAKAVEKQLSLRACMVRAVVVMKAS
jgi:hypothetical protein